MTVLFSDGFENNNFNAWTGTNGTPTIVTSPVHSRSYAVQLNSNNEMCYKDGSFGSRTNMGFYFQHHDTPSSNSIIAEIWDIEWNTPLKLYVDASNVLWLTCPSGSYSSGVTLNIDVMYYIEFSRVVGAGNGQAKLWINGNLVVNKTAETISANSYELVIVTRVGFTCYFDDVVIADSYIGTLDLNMNINIGRIPEDYGDYGLNQTVTYNGGAQICSVDLTVYRTIGRPSIKLDPHVDGVDLNASREVDLSSLLEVTGGDHVIFKVWMKVLTNEETEYYPFCGARSGVDFYGGNPLEHLGASQFWSDYFGGGHYERAYVQDSCDGRWQQRILDFVVPTKVPDDSEVLTTVTNMIPWLQGGDWTIPTMSPCWFADGELYVNPTSDGGEKYYYYLKPKPTIPQKKQDAKVELSLDEKFQNVIVETKKRWG